MRLKQQKSVGETVSSTHKDAEYYLTVSQLDKLIDWAETVRDRLVITILVDTGLRRFEAANLKTSDFNLTTNLLTVRHGKGNRLRQVPISPRLADIMSKLKRNGSDGPILRGRMSASISTRQINRIVAEVAKRAKIESPNPKHQNVTCHLIRHSFARHWKESGGNIEALAKILGHASVKTTWDLYGTPSISDVKRHYQKFIRTVRGKRFNHE